MSGCQSGASGPIIHCPPAIGPAAIGPAAIVLLNQSLVSAAGPKQYTTPLSSAMYNRPEAIAGAAKNAPRIS